jgi:hypothetical protein
MRIEEIVWEDNHHSLFKSARFDKLMDKYDDNGNQYRSGQSVNIAYWKDDRDNMFMISGGRVSMNLAGFKVWLCNRCQVKYNEWGEY